MSETGVSWLHWRLKPLILDSGDEQYLLQVMREQNGNVRLVYMREQNGNVRLVMREQNGNVRLVMREQNGNVRLVPELCSTGHLNAPDPT